MYRTDEKNYIRNTYPVLKIMLFTTLLVLALGIFTACGRIGNSGREVADGISEEDLDNEDSNDEDIVENGGKDIEENTDGDTEDGDADGNAEESQTLRNNTTDERLISYEELQKIFGEDCICIYDQVCEVELSQYDGEVLFVPMLYTEEYPEFSLFIIQDGEILDRRMRTYGLWEEEKMILNSLDDVAFEDVNFDGYTDIVVIATFNGESTASVLYGYGPDASDYERYFQRQDDLSDNVTAEVEQLSAAAVIEYLTNGKRNGEFTDYREAYLTVSRLYRLEHMLNGEEYDWDVGYDLIYVDNDDIPELAVGLNGYYVSLYTFHDGTVYRLMDDWGYGAGGNSGYAYCPGMNSFRNYTQNGAGAVMYVTFMTINDQYSIEVTTQIVSYIFDDINGNGVVDEDEEESVGRYGNWRVDYIDDEVVDVSWSIYEVGEYEYISPRMSYEELLSNLN